MSQVRQKCPVQLHVIMSIDKSAFLQWPLLGVSHQPQGPGAGQQCSLGVILARSPESVSAGREAGPHWSSWCWLTPQSSSEMSNKFIAKLWKSLLGILLWASSSLLQ